MGRPGCKDTCFSEPLPTVAGKWGDPVDECVVTPRPSPEGPLDSDDLAAAGHPEHGGGNDT